MYFFVICIVTYTTKYYIRRRQVATVTREAVFAAAETIKAEGEWPTQAYVREKIGGGSFSSIGPLLREWQAMQHERDEAKVTQVPEAVRLALSEVAGRLWKVASETASLGVVAARKEVEELKSAAAVEVAEAVEAVQIVEGERDAALQVVATAQVERDRALSDLETERVARVEAERAAGVSKGRAMIAEAKAEASAQETVRADAARADAERREAAALAERDAARAEVEAVRAAGAKALESERYRHSEALTLAKVQTDSYRDVAVELREHIAGLDAELSAGVKFCEAARDATKAADERAAKAEARAEKAEARADAAEARVAKAEERAAAKVAGA